MHLISITHIEVSQLSNTNGDMAALFILPHELPFVKTHICKCIYTLKHADVHTYELYAIIPNNPYGHITSIFLKLSLAFTVAKTHFAVKCTGSMYYQFVHFCYQMYN